MPAPLLLPAVSLVSGLFLSSALEANFSLSLVIIFGLLLISAWISYALKSLKAALWLILGCFFMAGFSLYSLELTRYQKNPLKQLKAEGYLDFQGQVLKSPERRPDRDILTVRIQEVEVAGEKKELSGNLRLTVAHSSTGQQPLELLAGDKIAFSAALSPENSFRNFFPDFMPRYLRTQKIQARAFSKSPLLIQKLNQKNHSPAGFFSGLRRQLQKDIEKDFPGQDSYGISPEGAVLEALLLGEDGRIDEQTDRQFQKTGLYHLLAISGAHVGVVSFLFYFLLKFFITRKKTIHLILLFSLIFYAFLVEGQPSVFRAVIMASVFLLGKIIFADTNLINTLSLSAIILLLINPFSLEEVGFQLTFLATLSLILFFEPIKKFLPVLPWRLSEMAAMSAAAVVGTMPIIVSNFNRVTFASLILNLAAAPLMGVIMGTGYVYLLLNSFLPAAGNLLAFLLKYMIKLFHWITTWLEPFSSLSYRVPSPPWIIVVGFYLFLLLFLLKSRFRWQKVLTATGFIVFFLILITFPFKPKNQGLAVTFMDVGQGDSIIIEFPDHQVMAIDAGGFPASNFDTGESLVSPYLWHQGYKKIDYLVCSHYHPDHAGGLVSLARNFRVKEFWFSEQGTGTELENRILESLSPKVKKRRIMAGMKREIAGSSIEIIYPDETALTIFKPGNDLSAVIRLKSGRQSFLFTGDITRTVEEYLSNNWPDKLQARVLKIPHHGSLSSSSKIFLKTVSPDWAVIPAGRNNLYGFPNSEILSRLNEVGVEVLRTDRDGAVQFRSSEEGLTFRIAAREYEPEQP